MNLDAFEKWPKSLQDLSLLCILHNMERVLVDFDERLGHYHLKPDVVLPLSVCDNLVQTSRVHGLPMTELFWSVFYDTCSTKLKKIKLNNDNINVDTVERLMKHSPVELDITDTAQMRDETVQAINDNSTCLQALHLGDKLFALHQTKCRIDGLELPTVSTLELQCPALRVLSLSDMDYNFVRLDMHSGFPHLCRLEIRNSTIDNVAMMDISEIRTLQDLSLCDSRFFNVEDCFNAISQLHQLRVLDVSCCERDLPVLYDNPDALLTCLTSRLLNLQSLNLSGTNLPGSGTGDCPILGLRGRHLKLLAVTACHDDVCFRRNLPADRIAGDSTEEQILTSLHFHMNKAHLLNHSLNKLFDCIQGDDCKNRYAALVAILNAMKNFPKKRDMQISGSASLFYLVKAEFERSKYSYAIKRNIIETILAALEEHHREVVMVKNGCLTLCYFSIPQDIMFAYEKVIRLLTFLIRPYATVPQMTSSHRIAMYLLNNMVCQVDGEMKEKVGSLRAIEEVLNVIDDKLLEQSYDDILEIAWSTLWNVTDETPRNCKLFLDHNGMAAFQRCLEIFPGESELIRNMMGLLGNVAEVKFLRPQLMQKDYLTLFVELLDSTISGIEISYNACGVLAHLMYDGEQFWSVAELPRETVISAMHAAIGRWTLLTRRNINYRSFLPILPLVTYFQCPAVQHWAIWALCNLCTVYPTKYCQLISKEKAEPLLRQVSQNAETASDIKDLANEVLEIMSKYHKNPDSIEDPILPR